jgi:hypothetical protein
MGYCAKKDPHHRTQMTLFASKEAEMSFFGLQRRYWVVFAQKRVLFYHITAPESEHSAKRSKIMK